MFSVHANRTIARPITEVFDYVADLRNEKAWNPGARRVTKLEEGPVRVGSTFEAEYAGAGVLQIVVTKYDRPTMLRYRSVGRSMELTSTIVCAETPGGCVLTMMMDVEPAGLLKLASPLMALMLRRQFASSADRLQRTLVSGAR